MSVNGKDIARRLYRRKVTPSVSTRGYANRIDSGMVRHPNLQKDRIPTFVPAKPRSVYVPPRTRTPLFPESSSPEWRNKQVKRLRKQGSLIG